VSETPGSRSVTLILTPQGSIRVKAWVGFTAMSIGMFMAILDIQIVASSLPDIQAGLGIELNQLSWVQTAYLIAEIVAIPLTGWLTRVMSTRGAFLACIGGFTVASLVCAASNSFESLIPARILQGFCGGALIPLVFSAIFLMFEGLGRSRATLVAGLLAMLAPTLGPVVGGFITDRYSWHWLFLINVPPGIIVALLVAWAVDIDRPNWRWVGSVDLLALPLLAVFLGSLQLVLKEAPHRGWGSTEALLLAGICVFCGGSAIWRCLRHPAPLIGLSPFCEGNFVVGCCFSFVLGIGLYGATFLLPVYLGLVRNYDALAIGEIMMVTGAAQLVMAPVATTLERRVAPRLLVTVGYALLAVGLAGNGFMTFETDFWGLFWQQLVRGSAIMLCLLPSTALALSGLDPADIPNASGLFNLMRNLGGAIGLALIDTVLEQRAPAHITAIAARLQAGDAATARLVGLPTERFTGVPIGEVDAATRALVAPLVERAGLVAAFNDAWLLIGGLVALSLLVLLWRAPSRT
jgi:MFS transporter, DHA2 family, multidrug resistance protein